MSLNSLSRSIIIIPSRLGSTRLPHKPLAMIHGKPMIWHVVQRALESGISNVVVAAAEQEILDAIQDTPAHGILTNPAHPSGSDRIAEALDTIDPMGDKYDVIVNLQGDLPILEPRLIHDIIDVLHYPSAFDIATLVVPITEPHQKQSPHIVKAVFRTPIQEIAEALYFSRLPIPYGQDQGYHHIGIYGYTRAALKKMVSALPTPLEQAEKLEQLRALELGLRIGIKIVDTEPLGVDTPGDLEMVIRLLHQKK